MADDPRDPEDITVGPDHKPLHEQPRWRRDFATDWPEDNYVARRDFAKFLVLTSGAFVAGQAWIAANSLVRSRRTPPGRVRIASVSATLPGSARMFTYPTPQDPCLLIRTHDGQLLAYSQKCTHLSCAVYYDAGTGRLAYPCHHGFFAVEDGRVLQGPPPRPLPRITLAREGGQLVATGVEVRRA